MIPANLQPLANHLWQSTLFAVPVALLALALRKNRAAVRYWLWLTASVKFLIPFSLLVDAGSRIQWRSHPAISQPQFSYAVDQIARPFAMLASAPVKTAAPSAPVEFSTILLAVWLCGAAIGAVCWFRSWRRINAAKRSASPLYLKLPIPAFSTPGQMEPGVFGIRKPVLLLPEGIMGRLTPAQLEAVFAHELCHVRRQDNLTAAIHTVVETIFWFHPLVWWIRARLVEEREYACDEAVIAAGREPHLYAESILRICEHYLASPASCSVGVAGGKLARRIEMIIANQLVSRLGFWRSLALCVAAAAAITFPVALGVARSEKQPELQFEVASIRPTAYPSDEFAAGFRAGAATNPCSGGTLSVKGTLVSVKAVDICSIIRMAYDVKNYQVIGVPATLGFSGQDRNARMQGSVQEQIAAVSKQPIFFYDIVARAPGPDPPSAEKAREMLRALLRERFHLALHRESKELSFYALVPAKDGPKLTPAAADCKLDTGRFPPETMRVCGQTMEQLARRMNTYTDRPVVDMTGISEKFDFKIPIVPINLSAGSSGESMQAMLASLRQHLGLRLEPRKGPIEVLVVDHVERPSEN